jgi:hypothetical protein
VSAAAPLSSDASSSAEELPATDAAPPAPPTAIRGRCRITGAQSLDGWGDAEWKQCAPEHCGPSEKGLALKLRATVSAKELTTGVTDVARVTIENTTDAEVRVPMRWSSDRKFQDTDDATLLKSDGHSYDARESGCLGLATCAELVLEPHASLSWNAIVVPMKRRSSTCERLRPTAPLPPGRYTLTIDTHIDADARIDVKTPVSVISAAAKRSAPKPR